MYLEGLIVKFDLCTHIILHNSVLFNYCHLVPPSVITPSNNSMVVTDEGTDQILISCTATGIPAPNITWRDPSGAEVAATRNNRILVLDHMGPQLVTEDGVDFVYSITRLLQINNTVDSDSGVYTCVADNGVVEVANNTVTVFVRGEYITVHL